MERWPWPSLDSFTMPFARQFLRLNLLMITLPFDLVIDLLQMVYIATKFIADGSSVVTDLEYKERPTEISEHAEGDINKFFEFLSVSETNHLNP